jgi:hypothetical protein
MLVLDSSDLVDVILRNMSPLLGPGVTSTMATTAGPAAALTSSTTHGLRWQKDYILRKRCERISA